MRVETVFNPETDVVRPVKSNRPFCNFEAKVKPLYVHPEMIYDERLRTQLVGEVTTAEEKEEEEKKSRARDKKDDDENVLVFAI